MYRPLIKESRSLRKKQTPQEEKLWFHLRANRLSDYKFRRQYALGHYIADFCCNEKRLIIELDGAGHREQAQKERDKQKELFFKRFGYRILRFWNSAVDENLDEVLEEIYRELSSSSS